VNAWAAAADDFGHLVHQLPEAVLVPASAQDVAATVRRAAGQGRRFAAQGRRHSVFGRAQAHDGIVADMGRLRTVHAVQLSHAKHEYDPGHVLTPGYEVF